MHLGTDQLYLRYHLRIGGTLTLQRTVIVNDIAQADELQQHKMNRSRTQLYYWDFKVTQGAAHQLVKTYSGTTPVVFTMNHADLQNHLLRKST